MNIYLGIDTDIEKSKKKLPLALASLGEVGPLSHLKRSYASIML